jgi:hypothetical protein
MSMNFEHLFIQLLTTQFMIELQHLHSAHIITINVNIIPKLHSFGKFEKSVAGFKYIIIKAFIFDDASSRPM